MSIGRPTPAEASLLVLEASDEADRDRWLDLWCRWPEREPAAHPGYLATIAGRGERPMCASMDFGSGGVLYPFLLRRVDPDLKPDAGRLWDITGPRVGYTGAFQWNVRQADASRFWRELEQWTARHRVVCSFARLSLFDEEVLPFFGRTRVVQPNIIRELQLPDEELWVDVEAKVRKNIRRAHSVGLTVEHDNDCKQLGRFMDIYVDTMRRRDVAETDIFSTCFFEELVSELAGATQLFFVRAGRATVAAELILASSHHAYSFLGGTLASAFALRPNDLLKYEMIRRLRDQGLTHYVLGGGLRPADGIFRYKKSFAPKGVVDFKVGERVHDRAMYEALVRGLPKAAGWVNPPRSADPDFFPAYRSASSAGAAQDLQ